MSYECTIVVFLLVFAKSSKKKKIAFASSVTDKILVLNYCNDPYKSHQLVIYCFFVSWIFFMSPLAFKPI